MTRFLRIRNSVHFRRYFDAVHPLFWPVLYWNLGRIMDWFNAAQIRNAFICVRWWGQIEVVYAGDRIEPETPNPFALTRPRWDSPVWFTDVPAAFLDLAQWPTLILAREAIEGGWLQSGERQRALAAPPNTS